ncbi:hypothetical protein AV521_40955 [Streptomyces sp. IMTB 2501]|nr:hypothetical protein AV521_40955 [Streptomyces sp. IMTB 2501]
MGQFAAQRETSEHQQVTLGSETEPLFGLGRWDRPRGCAHGLQRRIGLQGGVLEHGLEPSPVPVVGGHRWQLLVHVAGRRARIAPAPETLKTLHQ